MKALTVCQPYASLIIYGAVYSPGTDHGDGLVFPVQTRRRKRVENRRWRTSGRRMLAIHAGQSQDWLRTWHGPEVWPLPFGAIIGAVYLRVCIPIARVRQPQPLGHYEWLRTDEHVEGPWLWILDQPKVLRRPIPCRGAHGLWDAPDELLEPAEWLSAESEEWLDPINLSAFL